MWNMKLHSAHCLASLDLCVDYYYKSIFTLIFPTKEVLSVQVDYTAALHTDSFSATAHNTSIMRHKTQNTNLWNMKYVRNLCAIFYHSIPSLLRCMTRHLLNNYFNTWYMADSLNEAKGENRTDNVLNECSSSDAMCEWYGMKEKWHRAARLSLYSLPADMGLKYKR